MTTFGQETRRHFQPLGVSRWLLVLTLALASMGCRAKTGSGVTECIAPANAGGGWDLTCRLAAQALAHRGLVQGVVRVTNMPGAGGGIAFAHTVIQRQKDSRLLVAASPSTTLRLAQGQYGSFDATDVRWVGALAAEYGILAVRSDAPWRTLTELVEAWRRKPSGIVVSGGSAVAGQDHMKVLLLAHSARIDPSAIRYVPFDGGGEALTALLGGFVDVYSGEASEVLGQLEAGQVRVIAAFASQRLGGLLASAPTTVESGFDVEWITWRGFYAPGDISPEQYDAWAAALAEAAASEEWERLRLLHRLEPFVRVGKDFEELVHRQVQTFRELSREIGLIK